MPQKYLSRYRKLANSRGYSDPLTYLFGRMKALQKQGKHREADKIAIMLLPYGEAKVLPKDEDTGETIQSAVFSLD